MAAELLRDAGIVPLTRTGWTLVLSVWKYFPLVAPIQIILKDFYPMGRTSISSMLNLPGRPAWVLMELFSPATLLYTIFTTRAALDADIPKTHALLITFWLMHYMHRALLSPLRNVSMGPSHLLTFLLGVGFNLFNGAAVGGWLGGYGSAAHVPKWQVTVGSAMFLVGLWGNIYHEEILRDIRRDARESDKKVDDEDGLTIVQEGRVYKIPTGGLFNVVWYPHYLSEWVEWTGYMIAGGGPWNFAPALIFVVNEIATMLPRAFQGRRWYVKKFGDRTPKRSAVIPGIL